MSGYSTDTPNALLRNDLLLKPNQRLILLHPVDGYAPFSIQAREVFVLDYDRALQTAGVTTLAANGTIDGILLEDTIDRDVIEVNKGLTLYHLFMGISPPSLKVYREFPVGTLQRIPENQNFQPTARFAYFDGFMSPSEDPSPVSEIMIPAGRNWTNWRFHNPTTRPMVQPLLRFVGYTYRLKVIRNADLVQAILDERPGFAARKEMLGGLATYPFNPRREWGVDWIPYDPKRADIEKALKE